MRNNLQNDVKVESALNTGSKFNKSNMVSTSTNFGLVTPTKCALVQPKTKVVFNTDELIRLAAMVSPTYGNIKLKNWFQFIPIADVWPNYDITVAKKQISQNGNIITPQYFPHTTRRNLCMWALHGAFCTIYREVTANIDNVNVTQWRSAPYQESDSNEYIEWNRIVDTALNTYLFTGFNQWRLKIGDLLAGGEDLAQDEYIVLANDNLRSFCYRPIPARNAVESHVVDDTPVSLEEADIKIYTKVTIQNAENEDVDVNVCFAFRLSSFGVQWHKVLCGLGYGFDLMDKTEVELMRFFAYCKAYWTIFGIDRFNQWETSPVQKLISKLLTQNDPEVLWSDFHPIMQYFGMLWVTEDIDYIAGHEPQPVINNPTNSALTPLNPIADVPTENYSDVNVPSNHLNNPSSEQRLSSYEGVYGAISNLINGTSGDNHMHVTNLVHGFLDSEIMHRMYKIANTGTLFGRNVAKILKMMGLGDYLNASKVHFIGYTETPIQVQTITATSDTYKSDGSGKMLGEYAGKGIGGKKHKSFKYKSDVAGYLIDLQAITCDSGYCQGIDETTRITKESEVYHAQFDGLGKELAPISILAGQMDVAVPDALSTSDSEWKFKFTSPANLPFGYRPRDAAFKVAHNVVMGGFSLNSMRKNFITYNVDKLLYPEGRQVFACADGTFNPSYQNEVAFDEVRTFPMDKFPTAGDAWRFFARYPWMGNLQRIFVLTGKDWQRWISHAWSSSDVDWWYKYRLDDNFMIFQEFTYKEYAPMLPIEETYGTIDPDDKKELMADRV